MSNPLYNRESGEYEFQPVGITLISGITVIGEVSRAAGPPCLVDPLIFTVKTGEDGSQIASFSEIAPYAAESVRHYEYLPEHILAGPYDLPENICELFRSTVARREATELAEAEGKEQESDVAAVAEETQDEVEHPSDRFIKR